MKRKQADWRRPDSKVPPNQNQVPRFPPQSPLAWTKGSLKPQKWVLGIDAESTRRGPLLRAQKAAKRPPNAQRE